MILHKNRKIMCVLISSLFSFLFIFFQYRLYAMNFRAIPDTGGDTMIYSMIIKSMVHDGFKGIWFNTQLGAPGISTLIDTPFIDYPMAITGWLIALLTSSVSASFYILYIITYPFAAASMSFLLGKISENTIVNICFSVIYALLPYHFMRSTGHLNLSFYGVLPLGIYLALIILGSEFKGIVPIVYINKKIVVVGIYLLSFVIGTCTVYYALFCLIVLFCALLYKMIANGTFRPLIREAFLLYIMMAGFIFSMVPKLLYSILHGQNLVASVRQPTEAEMYGLKIIQLFMPAYYTRVQFLNDLQSKYTKNNFLINENITSSLGLLGVIGFLILCGWLIFRVVRTNIKNERRSELLTFLSFCTIAAILFATVGGIGAIFSYYVMPQFRGLNRISILIDTLAIAGVAVFIEKYWKKIYIPILLILCGICWYADVPYAIPKDAHAQNESVITMYQDFFNQVEASVPANSMIYELPMVEFPESPPVHNMVDYSQAFGYAMTSQLRWSYGGMKGRDTEAMSLFTDDGMSNTFVKNIVNRGFKGIYINTDAYEDDGAAINSFYQKQLKLKPIVSKNGKLYFYNLEKLDSKFIKTN